MQSRFVVIYKQINSSKYAVFQTKNASIRSFFLLKVVVFFCQKNFHGKNNDILKHLSNEFFYFDTMTLSVCPYQLFVYPTTDISI